MLRELLAPRTRELVPALRRVVERFGPDVVVHHQASFGAAWVCDGVGVARAMVAVAPAGWPSVDDASRYPPMPDRDSYPRWTVRVGSVLGRRSVNRAVDPVLNGIRCELGMPAGRGFMFGEQFGGALNLGMWSPAFRGPAADDPARSVIAGFPRSAEVAVDAAHDPGLEAFERFVEGCGSPPIVLTLGTTAVHAGADLVGLASGVGRALGRRVAVLGGGDVGLHAGGEVLVCGFVPHGLALGRCGAAVHHGGIGTTAAALRAGVPSVVVPFTHDQPDNARRVRMLGCGAVVEPRRLGVASLARALGSVMRENVREPCLSVAGRLVGEDGGVGACEAIERRIGADAGRDRSTTVREGFEPSRP